MNLGGLPQSPYDLAVYDTLDHGFVTAPGQSLSGQRGLLSRVRLSTSNQLLLVR